MLRKTLSTPYDIIPRSDFSADVLRLEAAAIEVARSAYAPYSRF